MLEHSFSDMVAVAAECEQYTGRRVTEMRS